MASIRTWMRAFKSAEIFSAEDFLNAGCLPTVVCHALLVLGHHAVKLTGAEESSQTWFALHATSRIIIPANGNVWTLWLSDTVKGSEQGRIAIIKRCIYVPPLKPRMAGLEVLV